MTESALATRRMWLLQCRLVQPPRQADEGFFRAETLIRGKLKKKIQTTFIKPKRNQAWTNVTPETTTHQTLCSPVAAELPPLFVFLLYAN